MKCPKCRAEIISNSVKACPYCGSLLAVPSEEKKKDGHPIEKETNEIAKKIKEIIQAQKEFYKSEEVAAPKKSEKVVNAKITEKKYSTTDIVILIVSLSLTFIVLAITLSLLLRR
jgi:glycosylphosphatidylinositol transamidase (GPIT) subunit GPI8